MELRKSFDITDLGVSTHFLGLTIEETDEAIYLSQKPLIQKLLKETNMVNCNPKPTPLPVSHVLYESGPNGALPGLEVMSNIPYRETLRSLLYLSTRTRPDLATVASMLGKFSANLAPQH